MPTEESRLDIESRMTRLETKMDMVLDSIQELRHSLSTNDQRITDKQDKRDDKNDERLKYVEKDVQDVRSQLKGGMAVMGLVVILSQLASWLGIIKPSQSADKQNPPQSVSIKVNKGSEISYEPKK
jgi:uncharacterized coiled-coil protein SlyX